MASSSRPARDGSSKAAARSNARKRQRTGPRMPRRRLLSRITVLTVALALLIGIIAFVRATNLNTSQQGNPPTVADASPGRAPDFTLPLLSGSTFQLAGASGHPVVLYFMAPTCATCAQGSQQLAQTMQTAKVAGAIALAIDVTPGDRPADLRAFAQSVGQPAWTTLQWGIDADGTIATAYGVQTLETMVVINAQGQIIADSGSPIASAQLTALLKSAA